MNSDNIDESFRLKIQALVETGEKIGVDVYTGVRYHRLGELHDGERLNEFNFNWKDIIAAGGGKDAQIPPSPLLFRLIPTHSSPPKMRHKVRCISLSRNGNPVGRISVGAAQEPDLSGDFRLILSKGYTNWSVRRGDKVGDYRYFMDCGGSYVHAPFQFNLSGAQAAKTFSLADRFDCVVMLTWSNWRTERRSNRYHYATRFAKTLPTLFVQPDLNGSGYQIEDTEFDKLKILHLWPNYGDEQSAILDRAISELGFKKPLLWTYNAYFAGYVRHSSAPFKVYHATEDYFTDAMSADSEELRDLLRGILSKTNLLVSVSEGVEESYVVNGKYTGERLVLHNGCDYDFWASRKNEVDEFSQGSPKGNVVFYQGGVNQRLDWPLILEVAQGMSDFEFRFCGDVTVKVPEWEKLTALPNFKFIGRLDPEELRRQTYAADVGIIPFLKAEAIVKRYRPLKGFEYVACGLPVVTTPIDAFAAYPDLFHTADSPEKFMAAIRKAAPTRRDQRLVELRMKIASQESYNNRFEALSRKIGDMTNNDGAGECAQPKKFKARPLLDGAYSPA